MTPGMRGHQDYLYNRVFGPSGTSAYSYQNPYNAPTGGPPPSNMGPYGPIADGDNTDPYGMDTGNTTTYANNLGFTDGGNSDRYGYVPNPQTGVPTAITAMENLLYEDVDAMTKYQHQLNEENLDDTLNNYRERQAGMGAFGSRAVAEDVGALDDYSDRTAMINANAEQNYLQNQMKIAGGLGGLDQTYAQMLREAGLDQQILQGSEYDELRKMYEMSGTGGMDFYEKDVPWYNKAAGFGQSLLGLGMQGMNAKNQWDNRNNNYWGDQNNPNPTGYWGTGD